MASQDHILKVMKVELVCEKDGDASDEDFEEDSEMNDVKEEVEDMSEDDYVSVEFLEDESDDDVYVPSQDNDTQNNTTTRKWPKKLPRRERNRTYKQYTEDDLLKCLAAVRDGKMTVREASAHYNVPKITIGGKLKAGVDRDENQDQIRQFYKEIKSILSFTNGTPYKFARGKFTCVYCVEAEFTAPEDLRNHTRTKHIEERTKRVDAFMRPQWENEILKLDIDNLLCYVCSQHIQDWNAMLHHLEEVHKVSLDQAYSKVIPYTLGSDFQCALCKTSFSNFMQLNAHMNSHYSNYICSDCGEYFLTRIRLKTHEQKHGGRQSSCDICGTMFTKRTYLKKHVRLVHERSVKFKCAYCTNTFPSEISRQRHLEKEHLEKLKPIHCEFCGKVFYWIQTYTAHKRIHGEKKYACDVCGKRYYKKTQFEDHMVSHTGVKSQTCPVCHKAYKTKSSLKLHIWKQHPETGKGSAVTE